MQRETEISNCLFVFFFFLPFLIRLEISLIGVEIMKFNVPKGTFNTCVELSHI